MTDPEAAVAMVQAHRGQRKSILLIRRAEREGDSWSGHWSFPGGWRHASDRDPLCTAIRELEEECGVRLAREQMGRALPDKLARRRVGPYVLVAPFLFRVEEEVATVLNPGEAVEALWAPVSRLLDLESARSAAGARAPSGGYCFPRSDLNGLPLWGIHLPPDYDDWLELGPTAAARGTRGSSRREPPGWSWSSCCPRG